MMRSLAGLMMETRARCTKDIVVRIKGPIRLCSSPMSRFLWGPCYRSVILIIGMMRV
jgi:hypothetical protein